MLASEALDPRQILGHRRMTLPQYAVIGLCVLINLIDGFFALMAIPTMTSTLILAPRVIREAKSYFGRVKAKVEDVKR